MEIVLVLLVVGVVVISLVVIFESKRSLQGQMDSLRQELSQSLRGIENSVGTRLDSNSRLVGDIQRNLGELSEATKRIYEVGKDISSLQDILRAPKLRGGLGELFLEGLLAQVLPPAYYSLQHRFRNGEAVDAVIHIGDGMVPVDSKFPLESFVRLTQSTEDEQKALRRGFVTAVKRHIDDVSKYIVPDEGTFDFALMYIPAENVYYEAIIKDDNLGEDRAIYAYALQRRVIPVSPCNFYAYLQAVVYGLKGLRLEKSAREIMGNLARLQNDFERFRGDFETLGRHISNAKNKYDETDRGLNRFHERLHNVIKEPLKELEGEATEPNDS